jgi:hypothetical protein
MKISSIKNKFSINQSSRKQAGFTLFVALIVSSLLLSIGLSLSNIILKQLIFSGSGRESQIAFYAADSGAECALYWDVKDAAGVTTFVGSFSRYGEYDFEDLNIRCGFSGGDNTFGRVGSLVKETSQPLASPSYTPATTTTLFHVDLKPSSGDATDPGCAVVTVIKSNYPDPAFVGPQEDAPILERTRIESRGYNTTFVNGACQLNSPKIVERAVVLTY